MKKINTNIDSICRSCAKKLLKFVYNNHLCKICYSKKITQNSNTITSLRKQILKLQQSESYYIRRNKKLKKVIDSLIKELQGNDIEIADEIFD